MPAGYDTVSTSQASLMFGGSWTILKDKSGYITFQIHMKQLYTMQMEQQEQSFSHIHL